MIGVSPTWENPRSKGRLCRCRGDQGIGNEAVLEQLGTLAYLPSVLKYSPAIPMCTETVAFQSVALLPLLEWRGDFSPGG